MLCTRRTWGTFFIDLQYHLNIITTTIDINIMIIIMIIILLLWVLKLFPEIPALSIQRILMVGKNPKTGRETHQKQNADSLQKLKTGAIFAAFKIQFKVPS